MCNRSFSIDFLKAVVIFGVVFIHGASCLGCGSEFSDFMRKIFRFGVPCFIVIWAYFVEKSLITKDKPQQYKYLKKRFVHLIIVFLFWSLLHFFLTADLQGLTLTKIITMHLSGYGWAGQYFFIILFQLIMLFPLFRMLYVNKVLRYTIYLLSGLLYFIYAYAGDLPNFVDKLGDRPFVFWIPYVFIGMTLAQGKIVKLSYWWLFLVLLIPKYFYYESVSYQNNIQNIPFRYYVQLHNYW